MTDTVGPWIAVAAGVCGVVTAVYGLYRSWQTRRQERLARLLEAAAVAVRKTEAAYVRPRLRAKMEAVLLRYAAPGATADPAHTRGRMVLFCDLQREVCLDGGEKAAAHHHAVTNLVDALRTMPSPPLGVRGDREAARHAGRLGELVEGAYHLRTRPSAGLIREFADFCPLPRTGGSGAAPSPPPPV